MVYFIISHVAVNQCKWSTRLHLEQKRQTVGVEFTINLYQHPHLIDILGYYTSQQIKNMSDNPDSNETLDELKEMSKRQLVLIIPINWHTAKDNGGFKWVSRPTNPLNPSEELEYILTNSLAEVSPLISPNYKNFVLTELENYDSKDLGFLLLDVTFLRNIPSDSGPDARSLRTLDSDRSQASVTLRLSYSQNLDERYRLFLPIRMMDNMPGQDNVEIDLDIDVGDIDPRLSYAGVQWNSTTVYALDVKLKEALDKAYKNWNFTESNNVIHRYNISDIKRNTHNLWLCVKAESIIYSSDEEDEPIDDF